MARARQGGWSGKVTAITNAKLKEAMKIILKGTKVKRINSTLLEMRHRPAE